MADKLTQEEIDAIAAFPHEPIQRIPHGVSGFSDQDLCWRAIKNSAGMKRANQIVRSRQIDEIVRSMTEAGSSVAEISEKVNITPNAVRMRRIRMGIAKDRG